MNGRIVLLDLVSSFLVLALVMAASAQTRTVGVNIGNRFRWNSTATWSSDDPYATIPPYLTDAKDTEWSEVNITAISGTNITTRNTKHYWNGTETTVGGWIDIDTGDNVNMTYLIISANLSGGDSLYTSSFATWFLNETVPRTYLGDVRETNHFNTTLYGTSNTTTNLYWDKLTGVLVGLFVENTYRTGAYTTSWSMEIQIISSDLWVIPEFSTWTPLMLIVLTSAIIIISRQRARPTIRTNLSRSDCSLSSL